MIDINGDDLADCIDDLDDQIDQELNNGQFDRKLEEDEEGHFEYN